MPELTPPRPQPAINCPLCAATFSRVNQFTRHWADVHTQEERDAWEVRFREQLRARQPRVAVRNDEPVEVQDVDFSME